MLLVPSLALWLAAAPACPAGMVSNRDTAKHCCWPNQVWAAGQKRCVGVPTCPKGFVARGEECSIACEDGKVASPDTAGKCCWPGQAWSTARNRCVGVPACPSGLEQSREECITPLPPPPPEEPLEEHNEWSQLYVKPTKQLVWATPAVGKPPPSPMPPESLAVVAPPQPMTEAEVMTAYTPAPMVTAGPMPEKPKPTALAPPSTGAPKPAVPDGPATPATPGPPTAQPTAQPGGPVATGKTAPKPAPGKTAPATMPPPAPIVPPTAQPPSLVQCPWGRVDVGGGVCCWPAQRYDPQQNVCAGPPACPPPLVANYYDCVQPPPRYSSRLGGGDEEWVDQPPTDEEEPLEKDSYIRQRRARFFLAANVDPTRREMGLWGGQLGLNIRFSRLKRVSFGMSLGIGFLSSIFEDFQRQNLLFAPFVGTFGVRLGLTNLEFLVRYGAGVTIEFNRNFTNPTPVPRLVLGGGFYLGGAGVGAYLGFDCYFIDQPVPIFILGLIT